MKDFIHTFTIALAAIGLADAQVTLQERQLSHVLSYQSMRFTECNSFIETCNPGIYSCASDICQQCTGLGQTALEACCATDSAPTACLKTALRQGNNEASATVSNVASEPIGITSSPASTSLSPGQSACSKVSAYNSVCNSLSPGVISSAFVFLAPCVCYDSHNSYAPSSYDDAVGSCANFLSTASPAVYSAIAGSSTVQTTPCRSVGNVIASFTSGGGTVHTSSATAQSTTATTSSMGGNGAILKAGGGLSALILGLAVYL